MIHLRRILAIACLIASGPLFAADTYQLDIAPQPLTTALQQFAKQSGLQIVYYGKIAEGHDAAGITGKLTAEQALKRLLAGTDLQFETLDQYTVAISAAALSPVKPAAHVPEASVMRLAQAENTSSSSESDDSPEKEKSKEANSETSPEVSENSISEVVVTGTHIRGIENRTNQVLIIDRSQIEASGYSSTEDLLRSLPQNFASSDTSPDGRFGASAILASNNYDYSSGVNLRGLGASSTLVLLDGHRLAPAGLGTVVDVSAIPLAAVDRVEIMPSGSSAIYGSDAVAGVVNIILQQDFSGAETSARYGSVTDGSRHEETVAQTLGTAWSGGNISGTVQFQNQTALAAGDRKFSSPYYGTPTSLLPKTTSYAAVLNGRQTLAQGLEFHTDVFLQQRSFDSTQTVLDPAYNYFSAEAGDSRNVSVAPGLRYAIASNWSVEMNGLYSRHKGHDPAASILTYAADPLNPLANGTTRDEKFTEKSFDLIANGRIASGPAGAIGIAIGASYRRDELDSSVVQTVGAAEPTVTPISGSQRAKAVFGEIYIPIVGRGNQMTLVDALELSAAFRLDDYSTFGSTTNPRIGLRWSPSAGLFFRTSYGTSFRAPNVPELAASTPAYQQAYIYQVPDPTGAQLVPVLVLAGSQSLKPERARVLDIGADYAPASIPGLTIGLDYYRVVYKNRILFPPIASDILEHGDRYGDLISAIASDAEAQAIVDATVAAGGQYSDYYGLGVAGVRYLFDDRQQNAATVHQSGADLSSKFVTQFGPYTWISQIDAAYIAKIDTQLAQAGLSNDLVNTFGNPAKWRGRISSTWSSSGWSLSGAVNAVGSYSNNTLLGPAKPIGSWPTVDLNATLNLGKYSGSAIWQGVSLSLAALNVLDRDPPHVDASLALVQVNYDAANANPLGRFVALTLRKTW